MFLSLFLSDSVGQIIHIFTRSFLSQRERGRPLLFTVFQSTSEISANGPSTQRILSRAGSFMRGYNRFQGSFYRNRLDSWKGHHHLLVAMVFEMISPRPHASEKKNNPFVLAFFERVWYSADHSSSVPLVAETLLPHPGYSARSPLFSRRQDFRIIPLSRRNATL